MHLLIAMTGEEKPREVQWALSMKQLHWEIHHHEDGEQVLKSLQSERFDILLLHGCLPKVDGHLILEKLWKMIIPCPPRVLLLSEPELCKRERIKADCVAPILAAPSQLCKLLALLAKKKTPLLSIATRPLRAALIEELLLSLEVNDALKGRTYIAWILDQLIPSPQLENQFSSALYPLCAKAHQTSAAAVERCVRHAIEAIFTSGSMEGIERYFGTTVDPERGKPTNRAFLIGGAEQLRVRMRTQSYSLA